MRVSGQTHEGWTTLVPLAVLLFLVLMVGGPQEFITIVAAFAADAITFTANFIRNY